MIRSLSNVSVVLATAVCLAGSMLAGVDDLRQHVEYLASPELQGRLTGTEGAQRAADYLVEQLEAIDARPLPGEDTYRIPFEFTAGMNDAGTTIELQPGAGQAKMWRGTEHVQALSFSDSAEVSAPVVFAGYGLSLPESQDFGYDSYVGLDVKDKIVVVLRYFPEDVDQEIRGKFARYSGLRYKAMHARELGALALVVVAGPRSPNAGETVPMTFDSALSGSGIVAASISGPVARALFTHVEGKTLEQAQTSLDSGNPHVSGFEIPGVTLTLNAKVDRETRSGFNVVGLLPATGDAKRGEQAPDEKFFVIGAHYDHLGHGQHGSSLADKADAGQVHHGADDNASGVAAVLEVGKRLSRRERRHPVVLAFWTGEELGLLGSTDFVKGQAIPTDQIAAYVNFDMVGRMKENRLTLQSVGSSSAWPRLIEQSNVPVGFDIRTQDDPYLPTDSSAFYQAGIPALSFFTGAHEDYHRPTDTAERINYEDLERITRFVVLLTGRLDRLDPAPDYQTVARTRKDPGSRDTLRAFTGTIPDYTVEVEGLLLSGVIGGGPADEAGLKGGDIIVELGGQKIANIYDYTYALDAVKIDVTIKVGFIRDGKRHETDITPTTRR